ncbi:hypothetical protein B4U80_04287 [Leptotrombidium deliense]|uniref:Dolichyl-diphosphooligosaccharide-protein glycosyltransferase subunit TMEM258 n=1 Tax=Leptotrombidium deliense TaxID=299467 RepID=A0A443S3A9_9ACAR|nr:hypothetical protein B4U80_04287 [Leptotrombidium deliense]
MVLTNYVLQSYSPYEAPISPHSFLHLTLLFIITGLLFMAWFFTIEVTTHSTYGNTGLNGRIAKKYKSNTFGSVGGFINS